MDKSLCESETCEVAQDKGDSKLVGCISELPDELLLDIVCQLSNLKEMVATSILSKKWRYVWTNTTTLKFNANVHPSCTREKKYYEMVYHMKINEYVKWVDSVLGQHSGKNVQGINILLDVDYYQFEETLGKWIQFVEKNRVKKLELLLLRENRGKGYIKMSFTSLRDPDLMDHVNHSCARLTEGPHPCSYTGLRFLTSLDVQNVPVSVDALKCLFSHCPFLEELSLGNTGPYDRLRIVKPPIALKHFSLKCRNAKSIEIDDADLVSLYYQGFYINLLLSNVPMLTDVTLYYNSGLHRVPTTLPFSTISCCVSQLKVLKLRPYMRYMEDHVLPTLENLNHLEVEFANFDDCCVLQLASFMKAAPKLQKLVVEICILSW